MASGTGSTIDTGKAVVLAGLVLQVLYFALFVIAGAIFHTRVRARQTEKSLRTSWQKHMFSLYFVSICIFVRSIVRVAEYAQGFSGYIVSHEVFLFVFDAALMFIAMVAMNLVHPSEVAVAIRPGGVAMEKLIFTRYVPAGSPSRGLDVEMSGDETRSSNEVLAQNGSNEELSENTKGGSAVKSVQQI